MIIPGGSGTVPAGLPQGETEGFYQCIIDFKSLNLIGFYMCTLLLT